MEAKQMSQVSVKWCCNADLEDKPEAIAVYGDEPVPVVPLSALRKWLEDERELSINHGEEGYVSILSLIASLGEVGGMYKETGLIRRQYMKLSIGSIAAPAIGWRVFCLTLLRQHAKEMGHE